MLRRSMALLKLTAVIAAITCALPASAYVGPGAGLTAIGSALALIAALFLALVGFVWYPIKRLLRRKHQDAPVAERPADETSDAASQDSRSARAKDT